MQLNVPRRSALAAAAMSVLGVAPATYAQTGAGAGWSFDSSTLLYAEGDGRVKVLEPKVSAAKDLGNDRRLGATVTLDVLSGATPNGAAPYSRPQTFSGASSGGGYTTPAFQLPKDPNFNDTRGALDLDYSFAPGLRDHLSFSTNFSTEKDYTSIGGGGRWAHDFNDGNTTLGAGINYASDSVNPIGGFHVPLSRMTASTGGGEGGGGEDGGGGGGGGDASAGKRVVDLMAGVTQLLSPGALVQLNYSASRSSGYLNDPYKILSVVDANAAPQYYVYEARPNHRLKQAAFAQYKQFVRGADVLDVSYRFMTDDWGIKSHTVDLSYRWNYNGNGYFEPHLRWYRQNAADFYRVALDQGAETRVQFASADPRLGAFTAYTAGLKYGNRLSSDIDWSVRLEYYRQLGQTTGLPPIAGNALSHFDVAPSLNAGWLILGVSFR